MTETASPTADAPVTSSDSHGDHSHGHGDDHGHHDDHGAHDQSFWSKYVFSTDHKMIGFQYMFTGMAMGMIGAFMAYCFRMQLAFPGQPVPGL